MRPLPVLPARRAFLRRLFVGPRAEPAPAPLVVVFLRGAMDGLNAVVPHFDPDYRRWRPTLALPAPDAKAPAGSACLDLDGEFSLHPALGPLLPLFREGRMAVVHAVGSDDRTRSHFEAQDQAEHGASSGQAISGGWIGRHLRARGGGGGGAVQALAFGEAIPESLRGAPAAGAVRSLADLRIAVGSGDEAGIEAALADLHAQGDDLVAASGRETLSLLRRVQEIRADAAGPASRGYPEDDFGRALAEAARLLRADLGLEAACLDLGGFDTHFGQGTLGDGLAGGLAEPLRSLGEGLAAFARDLGPRFDDVTVVVMTEFGRRVYENSALGTDHGSASAMLLLGGGLRGGKVHGRWPGLAKDRLHEESDLAVTTDYRRVLAEVLARRQGQPRLDLVFPGLEPAPIGVCE